MCSDSSSEQMGIPYALRYQFREDGNAMCPDSGTMNFVVKVLSCEVTTHLVTPNPWDQASLLRIQHPHHNQSTYIVPICSKLLSEYIWCSCLLCAAIREHTVFPSGLSYYQSTYSVPVCSELLSKCIQYFHLLYTTILLSILICGITGSLKIFGSQVFKQSSEVD